MGFSGARHLGLKYKKKDGTTWRVISERYGEHVHLIRMNVTTLQNEVFGYEEFDIYVEEGIFQVSEDQEIRNLDPEMLSRNERENYLQRKAFIDGFNDLFAPTYRYFFQRTRKEEFEKLMQDAGMSKATAYRLVRIYLQSGMQDSSLCRKEKTKTKVTYRTKTGRPSAYENGKLLTEADMEFMDEAVDLFRNNRLLSQTGAYRQLISRHYSMTVDGTKVAFPPGDRPSLGQFLYRLRTKMTKKEIRTKLTSDKEYRNNERIIDGTLLVPGAFPGSSVEIDTLEVKLEIVAEKTAANSNIGKPIIYLMVDRYSHCITSFSIGYNNNSVLGLSDLMLNMITPKDEVLAKYNIILGDGKSVDDIMPPPFIPQEFFTDRGSDYVSKWFQGFCNENRINLSTEPGALGSYKGIVEGMFRKFEQSFEALLIDKGVIQHRYDSNHEKEACLTLTHVYQLAFAFVAAHNNQVRTTMRLTPEMRKAGVVPTPNILWRYGTEHVGTPRSIPSSRYLESMFSLMEDHKAYVSRKGVFLNSLFYTNDDPAMRMRMQRSQYQGNVSDTTGKKKNELTVRIDPRSINSIYYRDDDGRIKVLELNVGKSGGIKDMTWARYIELRELEKKEKRAYEEHNLNVRLNYIDMLNFIANNANSSCYADTRDKKAKRKEEREQVNYENNLEGKMRELLGALLKEPGPVPAVEDKGTEEPPEMPALPDIEKKEENEGLSPVNNLPTACPDFFL